ncbi:MAG: hypothetical protein QXX29_02565 [Nitrososphaerota archaeon]
MVKVFVRTKMRQYGRALVIDFGDGRTAEFWGDPVKAVVSLLLFKNSTIGLWVRSKGLGVEIGQETFEAIKALGGVKLTWKQAAQKGFLKAEPEHIIRELALERLLRDP